MTLSLDLALRLALATLIGGLIGLNRNSHGKPAGLRTHALVALGSALIVIVAGQLEGAQGSHAADAQSRVIQGLITGIGFLGAGVILHSVNDKRVHGLTTAAAIWVAALFGVGCGVGMYGVVACAFGLLMLVLTVGGPIEQFVHRQLQPGSQPLPPSDE